MKTVLNVPSIYIQCVYGHKKKTLKLIKLETNTGIVESTKTETMHQFEVTGPPKNIEAARLMIEEVIFKKHGEKIDLSGWYKTQIFWVFFVSLHSLKLSSFCSKNILI